MYEPHKMSPEQLPPLPKTLFSYKSKIYLFVYTIITILKVTEGTTYEC